MGSNLSPIATQFAQVGDEIRLIVQFVDQDGVIIDLTGASLIEIKIGYPDGDSEDHAATYLTDGSDGKIYYDTDADDLDVFGFYVIQGKATVGGDSFSTRTNGILQVFSNVNDD